MPLGSGYSVEAQVTGLDLIRGLQFEITPAKMPPPPRFQRSIADGAKFPVKELFVKTMTDKTIVLSGVSSSTVVKKIKVMIEEKEGIPPNHQRIVYDGRKLYDHYSLGGCHIPDQAVVHLILRLRGGGEGPCIESELGIAALGGALSSSSSSKIPTQPAASSARKRFASTSRSSTLRYSIKSPAWILLRHQSPLPLLPRKVSLSAIYTMR